MCINYQFHFYIIKRTLKISHKAQWLIPVTVAPPDTEMERTGSQSVGEKVQETPTQPIKS
jgi:hypothetical protein